MSKKVLIVTTSADHLDTDHQTGLWLEEFAVPFMQLRGAGAEITVASPKGGQVPLDPKTEPSDKEREQWLPALQALAHSRRLADVADQDFDAVYVPGGHGPLMDLAGDATLHRLIARHDTNKAIIASVCHGPGALVRARRADGEPFYKGRRVTGFTNTEETMAGLTKVVPFLLEDELKKSGADYHSALLPFLSHIETDGHVITGQNPRSSEDVGKAMIERLGLKEAVHALSVQ